MWPAALVHAFTASGVVCALLATLSVLAGAWEVAFAWLGVALVIDGVDGSLAGLARVNHHLPRFSGDRLDLVIDYITYVFVPVVALLQAKFLQGLVGLVLASIVLLSSLFHFSDTQSKADDHSFVGFPAIWNVVAFYIFAFAWSQWATAVIVAVCAILAFVPLKWVHPLRTAMFRPVTLTVMLLACVAALSTLKSGFPAGNWEKTILALAAAYGLAMTIYSARTR